MSGECNYCGGMHAEDACDADRELVFTNGWASGEMHGLNEANRILADRLRDYEATIARLRKWRIPPPARLDITPEPR